MLSRLGKFRDLLTENLSFMVVQEITMRIIVTPSKTNMSTENQWLVQMYILLKNCPFLEDIFFVFWGVSYLEMERKVNIKSSSVAMAPWLRPHKLSLEEISKQEIFPQADKDPCM